MYIRRRHSNVWMRHRELEKGLQLTKTGPYSTRSRRTVDTHSLAPIISRDGHSHVSYVLSDSVALTCTYIVGYDRSAHILKRPTLICLKMRTFPPDTCYNNILALMQAVYA